MPKFRHKVPHSIPDLETLDVLLEEGTHLVTFGKRNTYIDGDPEGVWYCWAGNIEHPKHPRVGAVLEPAFGKAYRNSNRTKRCEARTAQLVPEGRMPVNTQQYSVAKILKRDPLLHLSDWKKEEIFLNILSSAQEQYWMQMSTHERQEACRIADQKHEDLEIQLVFVRANRRYQWTNNKKDKDYFHRCVKDKGAAKHVLEPIDNDIFGVKDANRKTILIGGRYPLAESAQPLAYLLAFQKAVLGKITEIIHFVLSSLDPGLYQEYCGLLSVTRTLMHSSKALPVSLGRPEPAGKETKNKEAAMRQNPPCINTGHDEDDLQWTNQELHGPGALPLNSSSSSVSAGGAENSPHSSEAMSMVQVISSKGMEPIDIEARPTSAGDQGQVGAAAVEKKADARAANADAPADISAAKSSTADTDNGAREMDAQTPITYLYLTFGTPLPSPHACSPRHRDGDGVGLPPCPDLSAYRNPLTWPRFRKDLMVFLSCVATWGTAYTAGAYSQPVDLLAAELGTTRIGALVGVTTFCMGFASAPMILAPFSEINGRYPVFATAGVVFTVSQAVSGVVKSLAGMLVARFLAGVGGSVFSTMVGGVIADMYDKEDRNTPMALFSGSVLVGTGSGPLVAAVMVQHWGDEGQTWKWIFWHQVILDFALMTAIAVLFKESRGSVHLSRKAKALNKWYEELEASGIYGVWVQGEGLSEHLGILGDTEAEKRAPLSQASLQRIRWITKEDEQRGSLASMVMTSLFRPFHFLFTEPIVFFFTLWVSFAWAILYLTFASIPLVFKRQYGFTTEQCGFVFLAMVVGSIMATMIGIYQENILKHRRWQRKTEGSESDTSDNSYVEPGRFWGFLKRNFPAESHESRLYFACLTSVLLPLGLYLFGFSAQPSIHWIVPTLAIGIATAGIFYIYLATFNYLADIYQGYASSALAAQSFGRNVLGGIFPLVAGALFTDLGEDAAGGILGSVATALTVVPWALVFFGERIRARSAFAAVSTRETLFRLVLLTQYRI
ncbi:hypothetical protein DL766_002993 [Monosporascus sp. MC13-8B]|nr:hypothetical protein DL766_002993 [Monosporascus sp. MC13-8B]